ncbi:MAG: COX15/CtaA family protein [Proteobacteria bacterium]|nr:COX15/CtaA family protein [Pseudomonadota bacterium]
MNADNRNLVVWLSCVCAVIFVMIAVGGVTRLTQSGLSMVDWRPIMGAIPPLTLTQWEQAFDAYKQYPEYQKLNHGMSLEEFKSIFYWEFGHRLLGRVIGIIYFIPFVIFLALGRIEKKWQPQLIIAFVLGGLQGLMGWYMVKSGLVDVPYVSHFRLAAHLLLAILILAFLFWLILDLMDVKRRGVPGGLRRLSVIMLVVLALQLLLGAFTAGLDAGYGFNTYPLMHGQWLADAALMMEPFWLNFFENGVMIQFMHRWVGALLLIGVVGLAFSAARNGLLLPAIVLVVVTATQFGIGVATLMLRVPVVLGSLHQAVACLMVLALVYLVYITRKPRLPSGLTG